MINDRNTRLVQCAAEFVRTHTAAVHIGTKTENLSFKRHQLWPYTIRAWSFVILSSLGISSFVIASDWHQFRGPNGNGVTDPNVKLPMKWSDNENVVWRLNLPGPGSSSPVIWGNHIYLTCFTGTHADPDESRHEKPLKLFMVCIALDTGQTNWTRQLSGVEQPLEKHNHAGNGAIKDHGFASNTPFATSEGVYVFFGPSGLMRFSHDGEEIWRTSLRHRLVRKRIRPCGVSHRLQKSRHRERRDGVRQYAWARYRHWQRSLASARWIFMDSAANGDV